MIAIVQPDETHDMDLEAEWRDAFGLSWTRWSCPECGYEMQLCVEPYKRIVLEPGSNALTPEIADESLRLRKQGRHAAANRLLAMAPGHRALRGVTGLEIALG